MKRILTGLLKETRPLPVIAVMTAIYLAFITAHSEFSLNTLLFFPCIFFSMYTVHFLDTYMDDFIRKEDRFKKFKFAHGGSGILTKNEVIIGAITSSVLFFSLLDYLSHGKGILFLPIMIAGYLIGISYSHVLSKNSIIALVAFPLCVVLAMSGAYLMAAGQFVNELWQIIIPIFLMFLGSRMWMDIADADTDKRTGKSNFALQTGQSNGKKISLLFLFLGLAIPVFFSFSIYRIIGAAILSCIFLQGYTLSPAKGIIYITGGVFLFLLISILIQIM